MVQVVESEPMPKVSASRIWGLSNGPKWSKISGDFLIVNILIFLISLLGNFGFSLLWVIFNFHSWHHLLNKIVTFRSLNFLIVLKYYFCLSCNFFGLGSAMILTSLLQCLSMIFKEVSLWNLFLVSHYQLLDADISAFYFHLS